MNVPEKMIKSLTRVATLLTAISVVAACSSSTAGSPAAQRRSTGTAPGSGATASGSPSGASSAAAATATAYVRALFVEKDVAKAARFIDPSVRQQAVPQLRLEIGQFGRADKWQPGAPTGPPSDLVVPVRNVGDGGQFLATSYKVHLALVRSNGSWLIDSYQKVDWDATPKTHIGKNPPFTCTPGFVTTLKGYPVSRLVAHYPVLNLKPEANVAGRMGITQFHKGELDVVYTARSTGLPQGPSKSMYSCFVRYAGRNGWQPEAHMNSLEKKHHKRDQPLVYYFFDSGNRFKGGNELSIGFFTGDRAFGHGAQIDISIDPNGFLPELPPPPK